MTLELKLDNKIFVGDVFMHSPKQPEIVCISESHPMYKFKFLHTPKSINTRDFLPGAFYEKVSNIILDDGVHFSGLTGDVNFTIQK